ncbi:lactococcin 972 family bacteriocin [Streptomyces sp. NPDC088801]|uniref:lactococcin 972 family bacteriocin n=1 Tax=Streptomyces sp. NPDC088801 TaxID=3365903 RepID=UPI003824B761
MRISGRSIVLGFASVALAAFSFATPAAADASQAATVTANGTVVAADGSKIGQVTFHKRGDGTKPPAELGNPSKWGAMVIKTGNSPAAAQGCIGASGGNWCYGYNLTSDGKYCYSNYYHGTKFHHSTVKIGSQEGSGYAAPGKTSYANRTGGGAYTCQSFYSIDE